MTAREEYEEASEFLLGDGLGRMYVRKDKADAALREADEKLAQAEAALAKMTDEKDCCVDLISDYEQATEKGMDFAAAVTLKSMVGHAEELQAKLAEVREERDELRLKNDVATSNIRLYCDEIRELKAKLTEADIEALSGELRRRNDRNRILYKSLTAAEAAYQKTADLLAKERADRMTVRLQDGESVHFERIPVDESADELVGALKRADEAEAALAQEKMQREFDAGFNAAIVHIIDVAKSQLTEADKKLDTLGHDYNALLAKLTEAEAEITRLRKKQPFPIIDAELQRTAGKLREAEATIRRLRWMLSEAAKVHYISHRASFDTPEKWLADLERRWTERATE